MWQCQEVFYFPVTFFYQYDILLSIDPVTGNGGASQMNNDVFETMPVPKAYFKMALPVVFGMVISLVYNMVDTWFIAKTQNTSLVAGVSLCAPVFSLMIAFGDIFRAWRKFRHLKTFREKRL